MSISSTTPTLQVGLTPEEKKLYSSIFKTLDTESTGIITGEKARVTFEQSGLPPTVLGEIWQIADSNNLGFLTQFGFCQAMRLIGHAQGGHHPTAELSQNPGPLPKFANLSLQSPPPSLHPQSTNSSFMQTQPSSIVPQNTTTLNSKPQDPISIVGSSDYAKFSQLFAKTVGSFNGYLDGARAREIFLKAKLPIDILGQIWNLVDKENIGKLDVNAFVVAMFLIQGLLSGKINQLPPFLPETVWSSVEANSKSGKEASPLPPSYQPTLRQPEIANSSRISSQTSTQSQSTISDWVIDQETKQKFDNIFDSIDEGKTGKLNPDQVASFLMTSNLKQQDLALIWDLSDIQNTGIFTKAEFAIALYLVNKRLANERLPNIVPHSLVESVNSLANKTGSNESNHPVTKSNTNHFASLEQKEAPKKQSKSSMDDLLDVFGSASSDTTTGKNTQAPAASNDQGDPKNIGSDFSQPSTLPKARSSFANTFKPSSTFGQTLIQKQPTNESIAKSATEVGTPTVEKISSPVSPPAPAPAPVEAPSVKDTNTINYAALRSVPPPPRQTQTQTVNSPLSEEFESTSKSSSEAVIPGSYKNDDLLADNSSEVSSQLSQANTDIANISNQIKSLSTQASGLHDKKTRAERELSKILSTKKEIDRKLKQLRSSYESEVSQVEKVDKELVSAKEEMEALRSEASISEAKYNAVTSQLKEKENEKEALDRENADLREKLGGLNTEASLLEGKLAERAKDNQLLVNQLSVKKSQVQVAILKVEELKGKISSIEASNKQIKEELAFKEQEKTSLENEAADLQAKELVLQNEKATRVTEGFEISQASDTKAESLENSIQTGDSQEKELSVPKSSVKSVLVDDVVNNPSGDMTGVDDLNEINTDQKSKLNNLDQETKDYQEKEQNYEESLQKFDIKDRNIETNTNTSSVTTDYKNNEDETPVTSPSTSDFQFPQNDAGIAGGMVGMPGVLVGVQRTESLTSSIQNNAALSVRDDNIDDISDKETLDNQAILESEDTVPNSANTESFSNRVSPFNIQDNSHQEVVSDGDKGSSGVGSFEIVNADDLKASDSQHSDEKSVSAQPEDESRETEVPEPTNEGVEDEEFPPIKELDYEESSSSDSQDESFDDAVDNLPHSLHPDSNSSKVGDSTSHVDGPKEASGTGSVDFDEVFNDLQPAKEETREDNDLFDQNFDDLEVANYDEADDFDENEANFGFSSTFTNDQSAIQNVAPESQPLDNTNSGSDEWEQLFAGFGNKAEIQSSPNGNADIKNSQSVSSSHEVEIQELVEMGFDRDVAISALERAEWNIESATNYLLDNA